MSHKFTNKLYTLLVLLLLSPLTLYAKDNLAVIYTLDGDVKTIEKEYNTLVEKELERVGFHTTHPHKRVNAQYKAKWGSSKLDTLSFLSVVNDNNVMPLLNIEPRLASFAPFNMLIYKKLNDKITHLGHLTPEAMLQIAGIKDKSVIEKFTASFPPLDDLLEKTLKEKGLTFKKSHLPYHAMSQHPLLEFEFSFEEPEDLDDFLSEFQNSFELAFINKGYLIAGYHNFFDTDDGEDILSEKYDAFWTYSLCHLEYSYNMFDTENARPDAGLFAPCTLYVYIEKESNRMVVGMPTLDNWVKTLNITDKKRLSFVKKLEREIPEVLTEYGMKPTIPLPKPSVSPTPKQPVAPQVTSQEYNTTVQIKIPTVPKVPEVVKVQTTGGLYSTVEIDRGIKFSKRVPPNYKPSAPSSKPQAQEEKLGQINQGRVSAYLRGEPLSVKEVENKLKNAGFTVLTTTHLDKKESLTSIVFTHDDLVKLATQSGKGFVATLRVLIDTKEKHLSITNPLYLLKGFMQAHYDETVATNLLTKITNEFKGLKNSEDKLKFQTLSSYQFMNGMPQYQDTIEIASGANLLQKAKKHKNTLFIKKLSKESAIVGVKLSPRTTLFTKRIGRNNAAMLPYLVLIENQKATILDPKYYIAYMYPLLSMSQFMTIATVPDAIKKECEKIFQ